VVATKLQQDLPQASVMRQVLKVEPGLTKLLQGSYRIEGAAGDKAADSAENGPQL